jgi:hypothetical protein
MKTFFSVAGLIAFFFAIPAQATYTCAGVETVTSSAAIWDCAGGGQGYSSSISVVCNDSGVVATSSYYEGCDGTIIESLPPQKFPPNAVVHSDAKKGVHIAAALMKQFRGARDTRRQAAEKRLDAQTGL